MIYERYRNLEITDSDVSGAWEVLNAGLLTDVKLLEYSIRQYKQLRNTHPSGRWDSKIVSLKEELHTAQVVRLYIKFKGKKPIKAFNQLGFDYCYYHSIKASKHIEQYSRICFLDSVPCFHKVRRCPKLWHSSKHDRWVKWWSLRNWGSTWQGCEDDNEPVKLKNQASEAFLAWVAELDTK